MTAAFAFLAAALGAYGLMSLLPSRGGRGARARPGIVAAGLRLAGPLRARLGSPSELTARIAAAGAPAGITARELLALKLVAALAGAVAALPAGVLLPGRLAVLALVAGPVGGFLAPDMWLARRARERAAAIRRELPAMLDLLAVKVESGQALGAALGEVGRRTSGPLAHEWRAVGRESVLGVPLADSLAEVERRAPLAEVAALTSAIRRAARHGAPLAGALAAQARDARLAHRRRIQEEASRAAPKIQLVVALLLVPSVLLLVAGALVAGIT